MSAQVAECLRIIEAAVVELGGQIADVTRTRLFLTNISRWKHGWLLLRMTWFAARRLKFLA